MQRNIITTITFKYGKVEISVLEKLMSNTVKIYNDSTTIDKIHTFIPSSISHVEKIIGGRISKAAFVIEPSDKIGHKISLTKETIQILGESVSKQDVTNLLEIVKAKHDNGTSKTILVQPLKFEVTDVMTKSYSQAPIYKKGDTLSVVTAVTTINSQTYDYINQIARTANLEISEILLSNQTNSLAVLSKNIVHSGASHIHIGDQQAEITINKNNAVVATLSLYEYGFKHLMRGIVNKFNCSMSEAKELFMAHASFKPNNLRVIYSNQIGTESRSHTNIELSNIIKEYFNKLLLIAKTFLVQRGVQKLPLVISGKLGKLEYMPQLAKEVTGFEHVSIFQPLSFIEMDESNWNALGVINFIDNMNHMLERDYDTIVHTNPNTLRLNKLNTKRSFLGKLKEKIGGKYDWN